MNPLVEETRRLFKALELLLKQPGVTVRPPVDYAGIEIRGPLVKRDV